MRRARLTPAGRAGRGAAGLAALVLVGSLGAVAVSGPAVAAGTVAAGADALTSSAVTKAVPGDAPDFLQGLEVTVSQTQNLVNQAIEITWRGWQPTVGIINDRSGDNFLQVMQCWGSSDTDVTGIDPQTCQYGSSGGAGYNERASRRVYTPTSDGNGTIESLPFRAVTGETVDTNSSRYAENRFWNSQTQNGVMGAPTGADGTGQVDVEVQTGAEAPGLGCGDRVAQADGTAAGRSCYLVVVPRGAGHSVPVLPGDVWPGEQSPFITGVWEHALVFPLGFVAAGQACAIGGAEVRLAGSELVTDASLSWQRELCQEGSVYTYSQVGEPEARRQVLAGSAGAPAAAVTVDPVDSESLDAGQGVDYAPVALSGVGIAFNIDYSYTSKASADLQALNGTKVPSLKLTPRLVAKLLTYSYPAALSGTVHGTTGVAVSPEYQWAANNYAVPSGTSVLGLRGLSADPEFAALNGLSFEAARGMENMQWGAATVALGSTDTARAIWKWILADDEARLWLSGVPDPYGFVVNPYYSTNADLNPNGVAFAADRDNYPFEDPWCIDNSAAKIPDQCMTDLHPYVNDMHQGAQYALAGFTNSLLVWDSQSEPKKWKAYPRQFIGKRGQLTIADVASAERYGLSLATLCDGDGSGCVDATEQALQAAVPAMVAAEGTAVRQLDAEAVPDGAYPLTLLTYVAVPYGDYDGDGAEDRSPATRAALADYVTYAAGDGQASGDDFGDLPRGYAALPDYLRTEATAAAKVIAARTTVTATPTPAATAAPAAGAAQFTGTGTTATPAQQAAAAPSSGVVPVTGPAIDPLGAGVTSRSLAGSATPADPSAARGLLLPGLLGGGLLTALGVPMLGRVRRPTGGDAS